MGRRNAIAGTRYRNTHASPYTAIVGDGRRLATELVVISARATQEIQITVGARVPASALDTGCATGLSAGTSAVLISVSLRPADAAFHPSWRNPFRRRRTSR
ncbi:hypothetical protein Psi01_71870 [Planobispora siamensis]|uniref:Uncharacterized protein n=1 Tax=Planobispora siamensis TaxID=936338 RepID=A0A8J3WQ68_9ACTN|nr:hypothetical protein Psi01_71870 [Planobispora siamensis]